MILVQHGRFDLGRVGGSIWVEFWFSGYESVRSSGFEFPGSVGGCCGVLVFLVVVGTGGQAA